MDFSFSDTQRMLADGLARYAARDYDDATRRRLAALQSGYDRAKWREMAELGWVGAATSEEEGGFGGPVEAAILMEGVGAALMQEPFLSNAIMAPRLLAAAGRADLLEQVISGEVVVAVALEEPGAPWSPADPRTRVEDGRLGGAKARVAAGDSADLLIVPASSADGLVLALVAADAEGVSRRPLRLLDERMAADVEFDTPAPEILLTGDAAKAALDAALDAGLAAVCSEALGIAEALAARTLEYMKTRRQFGQPLAAFQALQHRMADVHVALAEARGMATLATVSLSEPDARARRRGLSAAFCEVMDRTLRVGAEAIQLHGGIGMTEELPVGAGYRRLKALSLSFGGTDLHLDRFIALDLDAA